MDFGYFTLSDNRYPNNPRTPEQFVREIYRQALYAEEIGLHSAWIGEVILYFNYGLKPYDMVIEQMDRFMRDVAPAFGHIRPDVRTRAISAVSD